MKPKYTLIIKDNETNETLLELDVEKTSLSLSQKANVQLYKGYSGRLTHLRPGIKVDIQAEGFLSPEKETYYLDETCDHQWQPYYGLVDTLSFCKICGSKNEG